MTTATRPCARDRLLAAANELFYREGVHTVGIDRIIEHAGVAKASLYNTFGSKDELVSAYLQARHDAIAQRMQAGLARYRTPRTRLLGVYELQAERFADPSFNGCPFAAATSETHDASAEQAAAAHRAWLRALFTRLAAATGARQPEPLARQLHALYDGATLSARMDADPPGVAATRAAAAALLDAALAGPPVSTG